MRALRIGLWALFSLFILLVCLVWKIDRAALKTSDVQQTTLQQLDSLDIKIHQGDSNLLIGWASVNITPDFPVNLVGYRPRGPHTGVHDSLYARILVIDNGQFEAAIITLDLLIFPPHLRQKLAKQLSEVNLTIEQTFLSASHTHTGFGGWDNSPVGGRIMGGYQPKVVELLCHKIIEGIKKARATKEPSLISFRKISTKSILENRLDNASATHDWIRLLEIERIHNSKKAFLLSFAGHSTNINAKQLLLSGDYPNNWIKQLEQQEEIDFALFCSGMVGSHRIKWNGFDDFERVNKIGEQLSQLTLTDSTYTVPMKNNRISLTHIPIALPESQLRIAAELKVRDWAFDEFMGELEAKISILQLGNIVLMGMPCDFSGEIFEDEELETVFQNNRHEVIITSFNGYYVGYITADEHYDNKSKEEVRAMSWLGPNMGNYFSTVIKKAAIKLK